MGGYVKDIPKGNIQGGNILIFVTLGSQKFQFDRLLKGIDKLIEAGEITDEVFAQTGYSKYKPKNFSYKCFLDRYEFKDVMNKCDKVITHGGTGAIVGALKQGKKVIAIPRLEKYGEHVDDHQLQIIEQFIKMNLIFGCENIEELGAHYSKLDRTEFNTYKSNTNVIIDSIDRFICEGEE